MILPLIGGKLDYGPWETLAEEALTEPTREGESWTGQEEKGECPRRKYRREIGLIKMLSREKTTQHAKGKKK